MERNAGMQKPRDNFSAPYRRRLPGLNQPTLSGPPEVLDRPESLPITMLNVYGRCMIP